MNGPTIWCGNYPLPGWWDGVGPGGAEDACAVEGVDDVTGLRVLCQRPDGHGGRHMTAFTTPFAGMPAVITCAWPGTTPPCETDLTDPADSADPAAAAAAVVPLAGPLEQAPQVDAAAASAMLVTAVAGLPMGAWDEHAVDVLVVAEHLDLVSADLVATVASWVRRAWDDGVTVGRAELVDEATARDVAVQQAKTQGAAQAEAYGRVLDEIVAAAADAETVLGDDTADARAALATLLARIARAVPDIATDIATDVAPVVSL